MRILRGVFATLAVIAFFFYSLAQILVLPLQESGSSPTKALALEALSVRLSKAPLCEVSVVRSSHAHIPLHDTHSGHIPS